MFPLAESILIVVTLGIYVGFGVVGAWIYDRFVRPRLYDDTSQ